MPGKTRLRLFDILRGLSVISMMGFHAAYDLTAIYGMKLSWFQTPFIDIWRASISWTFLFIAGVMCSFSRSNFRRSGRYLLVAALIWGATSAADIDTPISFGIIFCMGACTLIYALLQKANALPCGWCWTAVFLACFLVLFGLPHGYLGIGPFAIPLPKALYRISGLSWLGIPGPHFASGDYYPVVPFIFMYLVGASMGALWKKSGYPESVRKLSCPPLEFVGRHALAFYILHQPIILAVCAASAGQQLF